MSPSTTVFFVHNLPVSCMNENHVCPKCSFRILLGFITLHYLSCCRVWCCPSPRAHQHPNDTARHDTWVLANLLASTGCNCGRWPARGYRGFRIRVHHRFYPWKQFLVKAPGQRAPACNGGKAPHPAADRQGRSGKGFRTCSAHCPELHSRSFKPADSCLFPGRLYLPGAGSWASIGQTFPRGWCGDYLWDHDLVCLHLRRSWYLSQESGGCFPEQGQGRRRWSFHHHCPPVGRLGVDGRIKAVNSER